MTKPYLSVVISAYNEEDNLHRGALNLLWDYLSDQPYRFELILVNDGSTDNTLGLLGKFAAEQANIRVIDSVHMGKAAGIIRGALASQGEVLLFTDMDQATPIAEFDNFLPKLKQGYDIVIGRRFGRPNAPLFRKILAYGMVFCRSIIVNIPVKDSQCGFKAFANGSAGRIFTIMNQVHPPVPVEGPAVDPGFDVEILYLGRKLGYRIAEVPVNWRHQESRRVSFVRDAIAGLVGLLTVRYRSLTNAYRL